MSMLASSGAVGMDLKRRVVGAEDLKTTTFMFLGLALGWD